jgi:cysteinyl-tRNA synthetase
MIRLHDTLTGKVVDLEPARPGRVSLYVCGPTVYNQIHIGNARTMVWFDMIRRYLRYRGFEVTYVQNYTDVDDKIIERANLEGIAPEAVANKYEHAYESVMGALGAEQPDILVRATQHIEDMVAAIKGLIDRGMAYESGGNVWFSVEAFTGYGKLSNRSLDDMRAGERIEPSEHKRNPLDFALWKSAKEEEPSWPSPWGPGRPGWHIECSVMSTKYLGMGFDIHGGGSDLIFPHHENEIAQAEALTGNEPFARNWLHAGMVQMEAEKMSKSLGNFVLTAEIVERFDPEAVRYWALMGSYRSQVTFSEATLNDATQAYSRWATFLTAARHALGDDAPADLVTHRPIDPAEGEPLPQYVARAVEGLDDDFNSAAAFAAIHDLVREANRSIEGAQLNEPEAKKTLSGLLEQFLELTHLFGFGFPRATEGTEILGALVEYLLELREDARKEKSFDRADAIRERLVEIGVAVEDTPAGPRWRIADNG